MEAPADLKYTKDHEWVRSDGDEVVVGITDFAQSELTDIVFVELPEVGRKLAVGDAMAVVESVKAVSDIYAPISGEVVSVNVSLEDEPELINKAPFGDGWLVRLKASDPKELDALMTVKQYVELTEKS